MLHPSLAACTPLAVRWFVRRGYLAGDSWGEVEGAAGVRWFAGPAGVRLFYPQNGSDYSVLVPVLYTGGAGDPRRAWWQCPGCGRHAACLYRPPAGGVFICRLCHEAAYRSNTLRTPW